MDRIMSESSLDSNLRGTGERLHERAVYHAPEISVAALRLVTLGGTAGSNDSGGSTTESPPGPAPAEDFGGELNPMPQDPDR